TRRSAEKPSARSLYRSFNRSNQTIQTACHIRSGFRRVPDSPDVYVLVAVDASQNLAVHIRYNFYIPIVCKSRTFHQLPWQRRPR
ncbi:MAG: hypothetical protein ACRD6N_06285, partial [Pyrinomonadaceae bacterium]